METRYWKDNDLEYVQWIHDELISYDKYYSPTYHAGKELMKMTQLENLRSDTSQCLMYKYKFELQLCTEPRCDLCPCNQAQTKMTTDGQP